MSTDSRRSRSILPALFPLAMCSCAGLQSGVGLYGGLRELVDDVEPVESQTTYGLAYEAKAETGGLGFEIGAFVAEDDGVLAEDPNFPEAVDVETKEYFAGARWDFGPATNLVRPYIGIGAAMVMVDASFDELGSVFDVSDETFGGYAHLGLTVRLTRHIGLGVDVRGLFGTEVTEDSVPDESFAADYVQASAVLAIAF